MLFACSLCLIAVAFPSVLVSFLLPRQQMGEIAGSQRPAESLLEEFLEFERQDRVTAPDVGEFPSVQAVSREGL